MEEGAGTTSISESSSSSSARVRVAGTRLELVAAVYDLLSGESEDVEGKNGSMWPAGELERDVEDEGTMPRGEVAWYGSMVTEGRLCQFLRRSGVPTGCTSFYRRSSGGGLVE